MRFLLIGLLLFSLPGFGQAISTLHPQIPQQARRYFPNSLKNKDLWTKKQQDQMAHAYLAHFLAPWDHTSKTQLHRVRQVEDQIYQRFAHSKTWGENFHQNSAKWWQAIHNNMNLEALGSHNRPAILVKTGLLRALPTNLPVFYDYHRAGEGYPFDNLQESSLWAGTPVRVVGESRDHGWVLVITPWLYGWLPIDDIAYVNQDVMKQWRAKRWVVISSDHVPLVDSSGIYRFKGRVGALYPLEKLAKDTYHISIPVANSRRQAEVASVAVSRLSASSFPKPASYAALAEQTQALLKEPYGWGGMYAYRDCSETMRDYFAVFGHWLPRNSRSQLKTGHVISLKGLTPAQKKALIVKKGKAYSTFLGHPGHVMLYIGTDHGVPVVFHDKWGLEYYGGIPNVGRAVLGQTAITRLDLGKGKAHTQQLYDQTGLMSVF